MTEQTENLKSKKAQRKRILKRIFDLISGLIVLALLAACVFMVYRRVTGQPVDWFGYRLFEVQSGSMEPTIMTKDNILTKNIKDKNLLKIDDIVVFQNDRIWESLGKPEMKGSYFVHRIIRIYVNDADGKTYVVTKGDHNLNEDLPTEINNVTSLYISTIKSPFVLFMMSPWGIVAAVGALIAFVSVLRIGYRLFLIWKKKETDVETDVETDENDLQDNNEEDGQDKPK